MIKKYSKEVGFIYVDEDNVDKVMKDSNVVFEQGFTREDSGSTPLTTSYQAIGKDLKNYKIYGNSRQSNLPDGYTEVEWIKSTRGIDLDIKTNNNMQIEAKYLRESSSTQYVYYSDSNSNLTTNTTAYASTNGTWRFGHKATAVSQNVNVIFETIQNKDGVWLNGEKVGNYTDINTFTSSSNLSALGTSTNSPNKLYYLKVKEYGSNTYDYIWIPCKRNSDNVYGLYDIVGNNFYTNDDATITAGNDVVPSSSTPIPIKSVGDLVTNSSDTNYGKYKIPVSDGTNTTNIYLNEPLRKVGNYADYIDYETQKVYRNVIVNDDSGEDTIANSYSGATDTTGTRVTLPNIQSLVGTTIYDVDTKVKPSNMYIKYKGR